MEDKYRGKRLDTGEWVYGDDLTDKQYAEHGIFRHYIFTGHLTATGIYEKHEVDPSTIGRLADLPDKNGKQIYENDVFDHYAATRGRVIYEDGMFTLSTSAKVNFGHRQPLCYIDTAQGEVIGNIHDNPELP